MRIRSHLLAVVSVALLIGSSAGYGNGTAKDPFDLQAMQRYLTPKQRLGLRLFFDTNLSQPAGQACASCHDPRFAFTDPDKRFPTSKGVIAGRFGNRNTPTAMYMAYSPAFGFDKVEELFVGGQFVDGRAATLEEQAKQPFLNPVEMHNPNKERVVQKVREAEYAPLFRQVYGTDALWNADAAYERIADAIAAFEETSVFNPFSSKYDAYLAGRTKLTTQEMRGLGVFEDPGKGNCAACHPNRPAPDGTPPLFTDFTYDNIGVPRNPYNPFYELAAEFNPKGREFVDKGLGKFVHRASENGKVKVTTLRNIALTAPYMHNGYFRSLRAVVDFYNSRDTKPVCKERFTSEHQALRTGCWPEPEVTENVNRDELGNLGLSDREIDDLVAFLLTLTDGWDKEARR
jgi:cytochrome c peroxidase